MRQGILCVMMSAAILQAQSGIAFEVASVKPSKPGAFTPPSFPLDDGDAFAATGGRFRATFPLTVYITFAYKIRLTSDQREAMLAHLPKWVATENFDIEARGAGNPTKDQMRLMMQSLLAERFQLKAHFETQQTSLYELTLLKPDKLGPELRHHSDGPSCEVPVPDAFPPVCDVQSLERKSGVNMAGSRDTTMTLIAASLSGLGLLGRPVFDQTGLTGKFDYTLEWIPENANGNPPVDEQGLVFLDALREQLGLKLQSAKSPLPRHRSCRETFGELKPYVAKSKRICDHRNRTEGHSGGGEHRA